MIASIFPYIRDILRLKTKPQRVTWFIYSVLGSISFFSQLAKGASNSLWLPGVITVNVVIIFLLSLKYGVGGFSKKDYIVLCIAALGLLAWNVTNEAAIALYIVILIDASATYLTIEKSYKYPETETVILWIFSSIAGLFSLLAVGSFNIVLISYPLFIMVADGSVAATVLLRNKYMKRRVRVVDK
ncbi:MAG: hypothetical protein AAB492_01590 [Patescibacteria group bacterium]